MGSVLLSTPIIAPTNLDRHQILRNFCHESVRKGLKRLENVISISLADLPRKRSWAYSKGIGRELEPVVGVFELHRAYISAVPNYTGRVTVPTLWDKNGWTIVNNESSQIIRMLNSEFNEWGDGSV